MGIICKDPVHSKTRVAIVGEGIEGLAASLAMARPGFQVRVFEKDASFLSHKQGYGLTLQQGGLALRCLGVSDLPRLVPGFNLISSSTRKAR